MSQSICGCGAQAGYPHDPSCPRPLFKATDAEWAKWQEERRAKKVELAALQEYEYLCTYARQNGDILALKNAADTIAKLRADLEAAKRLPDSMQQAFNSGDGSYHP